MGRIWGGGILVIAGIGLWYYGGTSGVPYLVNLGIGTVILGLVVAALPMGGQVEKESLVLSCDPFCRFVGNLVEDLELKGNPVVIPHTRTSHPEGCSSPGQRISGCPSESWMETPSF